MRQSLSTSLIVAACLVASLLLGQAFAGFGHHNCCCPECGAVKVCEPTPTVIKEKKYKWECECVDICIPGVKCPWAPCCEPPPCGKVKTVKKLKKIEYECEKCGYKWNVTTVCCEPCTSCR
jgi:hypothetical protein